MSFWVCFIFIKDFLRVSVFKNLEIWQKTLKIQSKIMKKTLKLADTLLIWIISGKGDCIFIADGVIVVCCKSLIIEGCG